MYTFNIPIDFRESNFREAKMISLVFRANLPFPRLSRTGFSHDVQGLGYQLYKGKCHNIIVTLIEK